MKVQINLQVLLAVALVVSIAGNCYGVYLNQQVSAEAIKSQELVVSLQNKVKALEQRSNPTIQQPGSRLSREEYLARRAAQERKQSSLSRMATQKRDAESRSAIISREDVQRRQQGAVQVIQ
ncbi:hypothetical protein [Microbulbifer sp. MCCC 1A16149]|uniref:hypothetical protein n=1 Tax=Microbulbifer sp. MCCC 1A16149 TaxID=3411322 RepID=UPI003D119566